ncbi:hypothetical protein AC579_5651 [Pseudocercospora musae]|uniref:Uncharacterized protein n=1 Tax=Pseudocercospora musae TaxID=113226 RepID=A0A139IBZ8_9PEZI|nr:hypothetical protein AC579_5651 [Pseudocercospora musae]
MHLAVLAAALSAVKLSAATQTSTKRMQDFHSLATPYIHRLPTWQASATSVTGPCLFDNFHKELRRTKIVLGVFNGGATLVDLNSAPNREDPVLVQRFCLAADPRSFISGASNHDSLRQSPRILLVKETTHAELFYDLFFVANLAVFTYIHSVTDERTLEQYICFVCVLWFSWYQVTLYDVRFAVDCVANIVWRAFHFGVMMGFAATGPMFKLGYRFDDTGRSVDQYLWSFTLILMASRVVLAIQYLQTGLLIREHKRTKTPMLLLVVLYLAAAAIYGSLAATFTSREFQMDDDTDFEEQLELKSHDKGWIAWYVVGLLECVAATAVSCKWRNIGYKGTHLIQRMSLLTLIILGEGVITLAKICQTIARIDSLTWSTVNLIDLIYEHHFGTIRQQVWAGVHLILHLCLVLAVQGLGSCVLWSAAVVEVGKLDSLAYAVLHAVETNSSALFDQAATNLIVASSNLLKDEANNAKNSAMVFGAVNDRFAVDEAIQFLFLQNLNGSWYQALDLLWYTNFLTLMTMTGFNKIDMDEEVNELSLDIDIPSWSSGTHENSAKYAEVGYMFRLTYIYFFIALGLAVLICTLLAFLSQREKQLYHKLQIACSVMVGLTICLLAILGVLENEVFFDFVLGPWLIPSATLLLFFVVVLNNVKSILPSKRGIRSRWRKRERLPAEEHDSGEQQDVENMACHLEPQDDRGAEHFSSCFLPVSIVAPSHEEESFQYLLPSHAIERLNPCIPTKSPLALGMVPTLLSLRATHKYPTACDAQAEGMHPSSNMSTQVQTSTIDPSQAQAAQIPLTDFNIPSFPPEARSLRALTLTSDIKVDEYQEILDRPWTIPTTIPAGIESLTLELFSMGYPKRWLSTLADRLGPNIKSLIIYSQIFPGLNEETMADAIEFFQKLSKNLKAVHFLDCFAKISPWLKNQGLMFLEINYTFRHEDEDFMAKIQAPELPMLIGPGLISLSLNLSEPENVPEDEQDPATIQGVSGKEGVMAFNKTLTGELIAALTEEESAPKGLRALNTTLYTLTPEMIGEVVKDKKDLMVLQMTAEIEPGEATKKKLLGAIEHLEHLESLEIVANPSLQFYMDIQNPRHQVLEKTFPDVWDMNKLSEKQEKLSSFKANVLRTTTLGTIDWERVDGKWKGGVKEGKGVIASGTSRPGA